MEPLKGTIGVFLLCLGLLLLRYLVYGGLFYFGTFRNHFFFCIFSLQNVTVP